MPTAPRQRSAVVAHVNSGQPLGPLSPDVPSKLVVVPLGVLWGRMPFMGEDAEAEITGDEELPQGLSGQSRLRTVVPGRQARRAWLAG
jgi:hypothetical protein